MIVIESFSHLHLPAKEIKKSVDFYTRFLDFELMEEDEKRALVAFDNLQIVLSPDAEISSTRPLLSFLMDVDDFTDALQELEEEKVSILAGPDEIPGGESVTIADPSGVRIELYYKE